MKRPHFLFSSFVFGVLPLAAGLPVAILTTLAGCTGAEDTDLFGASPDRGEDSGAEEDGAANADGGDPTPDGDGGTSKKDGGGTTTDSGTTDPDTGTTDAGKPRTIGCTADAGKTCSVGNQVCCRSAGAVLACTANAGCTAVAQVPVPCDDALDCTAMGHPNELCCATIDANAVSAVACRTQADCSQTNQRNLCDPAAADPCPLGGTCRMSTQTMPGFWLCF
jgi:hypothetical protein